MNVQKAAATVTFKQLLEAVSQIWFASVPARCGPGVHRHITIHPLSLPPVTALPSPTASILLPAGCYCSAQKHWNIPSETEALENGLKPNGLVMLLCALQFFAQMTWLRDYSVRDRLSFGTLCLSSYYVLRKEVRSCWLNLWPLNDSIP